MKTNMAGAWRIIFFSTAAALIIGVAAAGLFIETDENPAGQGAGATRPIFEAMRINPVSPASKPLDFTLPDLSGKPVRISDFRGNIVFLHFWATWCGACVEEMPAIKRLAGLLADKPISMVTVSMRESPQNVAAFLKQHRLTLDTLVDTDGSLARRFAIRSIPTTLIMDPRGRVIGVAVGSRRWDSSEALAMFAGLAESTGGSAGN